MNDSQKRLNEALAVRTNNTPNFGALETSQIIRSNQRRYMDQLIEARLESIRSAYARERVSYEDPFAAMVTVGEALRECSKMPKLYDSDEIDAVEIGIGTRAIMNACHWQFIATAHKRLQKIHGWALTVMNTGPNGELGWHTYSELEIGPEDLIREWQIGAYLGSIDPELQQLVIASLTGDRNRVCGFRLTGRTMRLPLNRSQGNILPDRGYIWRAMPGVIYTTRSDESQTRGFGISRLESGWDSITKLRLESHADAFRSQIFAQVVHPPNWGDEQLDTLMEILTHIDQTTALVLPAGKNADGSLVADLPSITFRTMAEDAKQKSDKGSGGVFSNLSSEFVRYCGNYKIPISEVTGNPGGAIESADVDATKAVEEKINEYNLGRNFDIQFIEVLRQMGAPIDVQPGAYIIKGWYEWEAHEKLAQQAAQEQQELDMKSQRGTQSIDDRANTSWIQSCEDAGWSLVAELRENIAMGVGPPPGVMTPITSSWVKALGYDEGNEAFYLQFHGSDSTFQYPNITNPRGMAERMVMSGSPGGMVHRDRELGVPARTPYDMLSQMPPFMAPWGGSQYAIDAEAETGRIEKMRGFGTRVPAREPNREGYKPQTKAASERVTGPMAGPGAFDLAGVVAQVGGARSFQAPDFASMRGKKPQGPAPTVLPAFGGMPFNFTDREIGVESPVSLSQVASRNPMPLAAPTQSGAAEASTGENTREKRVGKPTAVNPTKPSGHRGHHRQGRPSDASKSKGMSTLPDWAQYNSAIETDFLESAEIVPRINASVVDLSVGDWQDISKLVNSGRGFSNETIEKVKRIVESVDQVLRCNYRAKGNSMSFKSHPYLYQDKNGNLSVEYPCSRDWRKNVVGKVGKLRINFANPAEHGEEEIGTITYGWDEANDCPDDVLEYDREGVMQELERHNQQGSEVYKRIKASKEPDVSTEYYCRTKNHDGRKWQVDFKPDPKSGRFDSCLVDRGNCPSGQCDFKPDAVIAQ